MFGGLCWFDGFSSFITIGPSKSLKALFEKHKLQNQKSIVGKSLISFLVGKV